VLNYRLEIKFKTSFLKKLAFNFLKGVTDESVLVSLNYQNDAAEK